VRALIDRHHADLFHSLQLLFEDRLGGIVYTPVGHEWWDEGYWRFGEGYGDDRLAQQFLSLDSWTPYPAADPYEGLWQHHDNHHPERLILGVELRLVRAVPHEWQYVVATVQDNQMGFKRLADELGARYVLQVGNTNQSVNWELDPLALVSSEVPIRGRGVLYHQELEAETTFRFRDLPANRQVIRSFVNCFPSTPCIRPWEEARTALADFDFFAHGIDGPDGNIPVVRDIADLMAASGWGWHDKVQGDGFGHVLHDWAAIGRPLIGHAAHYRGLMGEAFWDNLVTCIDLDRYTLTESTGLIREITSDRAQHEKMSHEIRRRFEQIDYAAEAEAIRGLLA
jgi:hypothetical protein